MSFHPKIKLQGCRISCHGCTSTNEKYTNKTKSLKVFNPAMWMTPSIHLLYLLFHAVPQGALGFVQWLVERYILDGFPVRYTTLEMSVVAVQLLCMLWCFPLGIYIIYFNYLEKILHMKDP